MYPISHNTVSVAATVALPLPLPIEENNDNRRQRFTHHHKSMSCNHVYDAPTMTMPAIMMYSTSVHSPTTTTTTTTNTTNQHQHQHQQHYHGRKPSLVGFDPFDSSEHEICRRVDLSGRKSSCEPSKTDCCSRLLESRLAQTLVTILAAVFMRQIGRIDSKIFFLANLLWDECGECPLP